MGESLVIRVEYSYDENLRNIVKSKDHIKDNKEPIGEC